MMQRDTEGFEARYLDLRAPKGERKIFEGELCRGSWTV